MMALVMRNSQLCLFSMQGRRFDFLLLISCQQLFHTDKETYRANASLTVAFPLVYAEIYKCLITFPLSTPLMVVVRERVMEQ